MTRMRFYFAMMLSLAVVSPVWADEGDSALAAQDASLAKIDQRVKRIERILENQVLLELLQRVESLQDEVRELRGEIESQGYELESMKKRQRDLYLDSDRRLRDLELAGGGISQSSGSSDLSDSGSSSSSTLSSTVSSTVAASASTASSTASTTSNSASNQTTTTSTASSGDPVQEKAAYTQAFNYLKEGRYEGAINAFSEFLSAYPAGNYADNAQYWLGEANYVSRFFEEAVKQFTTVIERYPSSPKISDARLKIGYAYYELQNWEAARGTLTSLAADFPGTSVARLANKRLARMRDEGHI
ncbi:MAG: tol-pal system protein YbgF [Pseudomonadota bacterium]